MVKITKEELERLYREKPIKEAAKILGISIPTLLKYVDQCGIERKGSGSSPKIEVIYD